MENKKEKVKIENKRENLKLIVVLVVAFVLESKAL